MHRAMAQSSMEVGWAFLYLLQTVIGFPMGDVQ